MPSLREYARKRRFDRTAEPRGAVAREGPAPERLFVVQKHRATALHFTLAGRKLKGSWRLIRTRGRQWLLIKSRDGAASTDDVTLAKPRSVLTRRLMAGIARDAGGDLKTAATADP